MTAQQQYAYWRAEAERDRQAMMNATDPAEIARRSSCVLISKLRWNFSASSSRLRNAEATKYATSSMSVMDVAGERQWLDVKRQEVVSGSAESRHGCDSSNALMRAMPVVVMRPALKHGAALG